MTITRNNSHTIFGSVIWKTIAFSAIALHQSAFCFASDNPSDKENQSPLTELTAKVSEENKADTQTQATSPSGKLERPTKKEVAGSVRRAPLPRSLELQRGEVSTRNEATGSMRREPFSQSPQHQSEKRVRRPTHSDRLEQPVRKDVAGAMETSPSSKSTEPSSGKKENQRTASQKLKTPPRKEFAGSKRYMPSHSSAELQLGQRKSYRIPSAGLEASADNELSGSKQYVPSQQPVDTTFKENKDQHIATEAAPASNGNNMASPTAPMPSPKSKELKSRIQVGANYTYLNLTPHGHQTFDGNLGGMQALYEYRPLNRFYGGAKFAWRQGDSHSPAGKRSILYFDVQERLGYTFGSEMNHWRLSLFSGFAYRYIGQKLNPKGSSSLRFNYNEFYVPVGFLANYDVNSWFGCGLDFIWMPQVFPTVSIHPLKGNHWTLENTLANFFVELPLTFTLTQNKRFMVIVKPTYEHWEDGHSTARTATGIRLGLPGNTYNFYGIDVNFGYNF